MITRRTLLQSLAAVPLFSSAMKSAPNDRISVGCIGTGARGQELMQAILQTQGVEIVGVVDAYTGRVARAIDRTEGRAKNYPDYMALLADKSVDVVFVATPDHWHKKIIIDALQHGKDVYSEKPMTYRAAEGKEIIAAARANERIVQIGSQGVSSHTQQAAREAIQSGKLGRVTMIRAAYNRNTASGAWIYPIPPDASPATVNWDMFQGPAPRHPYSPERFFRWRCYSDYSGGIATDLFVHLCTSIHYMMDAKAPARAIALGELYRWKESRDVPDTLNAVLEYPEGFTVNLSSTFNNQLAMEGGFQILGTEGSLVLGDELVFYPEHAVEDNKWIVDSWPKAMEDAYFRDPKVIAAEITPSGQKRLAPEKLGADQEDATLLHVGHFFDSVRSRKPYWEDASAGHHAAACAHMVNQSARQKRIVEWDFQNDNIKA